MGVDWLLLGGVVVEQHSTAPHRQLQLVRLFRGAQRVALAGATATSFLPFRTSSHPSSLVTSHISNNLDLPLASFVPPSVVFPTYFVPNKKGCLVCPSSIWPALTSNCKTLRASYTSRVSVSVRLPPSTASSADKPHMALTVTSASRNPTRTKDW